MSGRWLELEQFLDRVDYLSSLASHAVSNEQTVATVLINHIGDLECPPTHLRVKLEVGNSDVMWILSS